MTHLKNKRWLLQVIVTNFNLGQCIISEQSSHYALNFPSE